MIKKYITNIRTICSLLAICSLMFLLPVTAICDGEWIFLDQKEISDNLPESANIPKPDEKVVTNIKKRGNALYQKLLEFKKDPIFLSQGLAYPKAKQWDASVQQLDNDCSSELNKIPRQYWAENADFWDLCIATSRLQQIGLQYAMHEGADDKLSIRFKKEIEEAFLSSK